MLRLVSCGYAMKSEAEAVRALSLYADTVRRICFLHVKNRADVEDVFQNVFLKYILHDRPFDSDAHEKAWLVRVAVNQCKDVLKSFFRRKVFSIEDVEIEPAYTLDERDSEILGAVLQLPDPYRDVVYLFYYEGYTAVEIAGIMKKNENTIYTWLSRAKTRLKTSLGGDFFVE